MELFKLVTQVSLKKSEKRKIMELQDEYGFCTSAIVFHLAYQTANYIIKGKSISTVLGPRGVISRCALDLYRPFARSIKKTEKYLLSTACPFSHENLNLKLKEAGILEANSFFVAIIRSIIKQPYEAASIRIRGVWTKKHNNIMKIKRLTNANISSCVKLPIEVFEKFKEISQRKGGTTKNMIVEVVKSICNIHFNNLAFTENHKIFKKFVLSPPRIIEEKTDEPCAMLYFSLADLRLSVQMKAIVEKYGIPSIRDFIKRIVYFIILVDNGDVKLSTIRVVDEIDYNEERIIRNAYMKEVIYGVY